MSIWAAIEKKVEEGERLTSGEGVFLFKGAELNALGRLADRVRERKVGKRASYVLNRYFNYSNVCILSCQFCAFARKKREAGAFELSVEEMREAAGKSVEQGITEIHIVGGLHPSLPYSFYLEMLRALAGLKPRPVLKVFTAIEIRHLAERVAKKPMVEVLADLKEAGLGALTGGGAEIFDAGVRDRICRGKESAEEWLEVHRIWHGMGGRSTATMLYGHVETAEQRVDHLEKLRGLQDETGGFTGFVPFAFEPAQTRLAELGEIRRASPLEELRVMASSRLILDNFDHITAYWVSTGLQLAQVALSYGADDLHGTIEEEKIFHMAGAQTPVGQTRMNLERAIREAGRTAVQRDTFYEKVEAGEGVKGRGGVPPVEV
ncbi:MAG: aminofutalosine synthase MqnE [Verrucomicrobia bacterium]|nr:aminofutalosine synthase MqnE [Verrucomicrobiota bacterium]